MKGRILHFRQNRHSTTGNQMLVSVDGVDDREKAGKLVGKNVTYDTGKNKIAGVVAGAHGNSGVLRVRFNKGMPGQAIGKDCEIQ